MNEAATEAKTESTDAIEATLQALDDAISTQPASIRYLQAKDVIDAIAESFNIDLDEEAEEAREESEQLLREIRENIKRGDIDQALLLIHYELGDY